ncbi:MAG: arsenate reductase (glutaredoxin) [Pseudomonadota bacterium]
MAITVYHNPRCSKSRQTVALLRERGIEPELVEYLKEPPTVDTLALLAELLDVEPREMMRHGESEYRELGLDDPAVGREALLQAIADHPRLLERPIVVNGDRAAIGRPPESVLEILA